MVALLEIQKIKQLQKILTQLNIGKHRPASNRTMLAMLLKETSHLGQHGHIPDRHMFQRVYLTKLSLKMQSANLAITQETFYQPLQSKWSPN